MHLLKKNELLQAREQIMKMENLYNQIISLNRDESNAKNKIKNINNIPLLPDKPGKFKYNISIIWYIIYFSVLLHAVYIAEPDVWPFLTIIFIMSLIFIFGAVPFLIECGLVGIVVLIFLLFYLTFVPTQATVTFVVGALISRFTGRSTWNRFLRYLNLMSPIYLYIYISFLIRRIEVYMYFNKVGVGETVIELAPPLIVSFILVILILYVAAIFINSEIKSNYNEEVAEYNNYLEVKKYNQSIHNQLDSIRERSISVSNNLNYEISYFASNFKWYPNSYISTKHCNYFITYIDDYGAGTGVAPLKDTLDSLKNDINFTKLSNQYHELNTFLEKEIKNIQFQINETKDEIISEVDGVISEVEDVVVDAAEDIKNTVHHEQNVTRGVIASAAAAAAATTTAKVNSNVNDKAKELEKTIETHN